MFLAFRQKIPPRFLAMGDHRRSHLFGLRATSSGDTYRTHVDCVRDGGVLLVDPTLRDAIACRHAFHDLASDYFFAGRRGTLPNFHSYSQATAAHRSALDSGRSSGSRHSAITCIATLNLCSFSGLNWTVLREVTNPTAKMAQTKREIVAA